MLQVSFQVEKAFREGTARQNAHSIFVSLALKLLEGRVYVAFKEIITLEKQVIIVGIIFSLPFFSKCTHFLSSLCEVTKMPFYVVKTSEQK